MSKQYNRLGGASVGRSVFDLSYEKKLTCDMGKLIPVMCDEMVPGDVFEMGNEVVIRFQPLVAPILHEINAYVHYFFVPYRLLWDDWELFITGGVLGDGKKDPSDEEAVTLPLWKPTLTTSGSLWDHMGFPIGVDPDGFYPIQFPMNAYNKIYNEYYRDETLIEEVELTQETILNRAWEKDYFSSALPWQQRGTAPSLPISGNTTAVWNISSFPNASLSTVTLDVNPSGIDKRIGTSTGSADAAANILGVFNDNVVDLSSATTFDISDLRLAFQIQRWLERNARAGARYTEFLRAHFGVSPRDDRLDRAEYVGGSKSPVIISEVLQTSATGEDTPQGNLAGHGMTVDSGYVGKYRAEEYGLIMGILSVMPRTAYSQGINRQWIKSTKYDFYSPEFANLSEQAILQGEIYASGDSTENNTIFGYQGRYDEMRTKSSMFASGMRETFDYWHLGRQFGSAPVLNETFITCTPRKDIFAVPSEDGLIVNISNRIKAVRPMPAMSEPGLIDHV